MRYVQSVFLLLILMGALTTVAFAQDDGELDVVILKYVTKQMPDFSSSSIGTWVHSRTDTTMIVLSDRRLLAEGCSYFGCQTLLYNSDSNLIFTFKWNGREYSRFPLDSTKSYRDSMEVLYHHQVITDMLSQFEMAGYPEIAQAIGDELAAKAQDSLREGGTDSPDTKDSGSISDSMLNTTEPESKKPVHRRGRVISKSQNPKSHAEQKQNRIIYLTTPRQTESKAYELLYGLSPGANCFYTALTSGASFTTSLFPYALYAAVPEIDSIRKLESIAGLPSLGFRWKLSRSSCTVSGEYWLAPSSTLPFAYSQCQLLDSLQDVFFRTDDSSHRPIFLPTGRARWRSLGLPTRLDVTLSDEGGFFKLHRELVSIEKTRAPLSAFAVPPGYKYKSLLEQ